MSFIRLSTDICQMNAWYKMYLLNCSKQGIMDNKKKGKFCEIGLWRQKVRELSEPEQVTFPFWMHVTFL